MQDPSPVWQTVRPKICADGTVAPQANIPAAAQTPPAANHAGLIVIPAKFSHAQQLAASKSGGRKTTEILMGSDSI
jgi:hypothetical protein